MILPLYHFLTFLGHARYVSCCAFNSDGAILATGSNDKSIQIWALKGHILDACYGTTTDKAIKRDVSILSDSSSDFTCPITQDVMKYPVMCSDGYIYEKAAIQEWLLSRRKTSPMTNLPIEDLTLVPQKDLQKKIREKACV